MVRAAMWVVILVSSANSLFADPRTPRDPVEAPPPAQFAADPAANSAVELADSSERVEELKHRIEAARQQARAEAERLRRVQEARANALRLQREFEERQEKQRQELQEEHQRRAEQMRRQAELARQRSEEAAREQAMAQARARARLEAQQRERAESRAPAGSTTRTVSVADLLATLPGRRDAMFASPEDLIAALKAVSGAENWEHEGGMTINRRSLTLTILHRRDIIQRVQNQLTRFHQRSPGNLRITMRILIVPDNAQIGLSRDRATLISSERRADIYEKYQGRHEKSDSRDYERQHTICNGDLLYAWTSTMTEADATYRGVTVVCEIESQSHAVKITPIPFVGDEDQVNWRPLTLTPGQSIAYELPPVNVPGEKPDTIRAIAFVTLDAISPAAE